MFSKLCMKFAKITSSYKSKCKPKYVPAYVDIYVSYAYICFYPFSKQIKRNMKYMLCIAKAWSLPIATYLQAT